uniref:BphX family protein n=1 Tax=Pandoraea pnomenusa TaxID=93220 RepID=Q46374_9BURK|nr:unknown [Pandoraea pnomenusa]
MKQVRVFLIAVGIFYLLNLVGTLPFRTLGLLDMMYRAVPMNVELPVFKLLQDAWFVIGLQLAAIGVVALRGARDPQRGRALIPVVIATEFVTGLWDLYSVVLGRMALGFWLALLLVHAAWIIWALRVLRGGSESAQRDNGIA